MPIDLVDKARENSEYHWESYCCKGQEKGWEERIKSVNESYFGH
jgi:hypothetical protein